jgi:hypothetical protein
METVPNTFPGMFWGYLVFFALVFIYVVSLAVRVRRLESKRSCAEKADQAQA